MANDNAPKISKRVRFEVFKRDSFTCQYCGAESPAVVLHVDHIHPQSDDGGSDPSNLVTACEACNLGKSNVPLSDTSSISKRKHQLDQLQERREQLEMMFEWQQELLTLDSEVLDRTEEFFVEVVGNDEICLTDAGRDQLNKAIKRFGLNEVLEAIPETVTAYVKKDENGKATKESIAIAFHKLGPVCATRKRLINEPYLKALYYIRGILRNRLRSDSTYDDSACVGILKQAVVRGVPAEALQDLSCRSTSWRQFRADVRFMETDYAPRERR